MKTMLICQTCRCETRPSFGGGTEHIHPIDAADCENRRGDLPILVLRVRLCDRGSCNRAADVITPDGAECSGHAAGRVTSVRGIA